MTQTAHDSDAGDRLPVQEHGTAEDHGTAERRGTTESHGTAGDHGTAASQESTGYTWARRSDLAPPAPSDGQSDSGRQPAASYPPVHSGASGQAPVGYSSWSGPDQDQSGAGTTGYGPSGYGSSAAGYLPGSAGSQGYGPSGHPQAPGQPTSYGSTTTMPLPGQAPAQTASGSGSFGGPPAPPRREPRRPGWGGVVAMGAGAAVLASLLTAGVLKATDDDTVTSSGTAATSQSSSPQAKAPVSSSSTSNPNWNAVASAVEPSVVAVTVSTQQGEGAGSGVILDKEGRIATNNHVVTGAGSNATVKVTLNDGRTYDASVVGTDSATDLAVIKISNPPSDLTPATLGNSQAAKVGDPVMAVGNPLELAGTVTTGIISALDRPVTTSASESSNPLSGGSTSEPVITDAIQTDAAVNPGNSGGALVDAQGRVIGIPSSIASLDSSSMFGQSSQSGSIGLGFAIPIDEVKDVSSQLIKSGTVKHSYLGVILGQDGTVTVGGASRNAAQIKAVTSGAPAAKAGLKGGDAIIAVDGEFVNGQSSLVGQLRQRSPGTAVKLTVIRNGRSQDITVTLGTKPATTG